MEDWQVYIIPDAKAFVSPAHYDKWRSEIKYYDTFKDAKERFEQLLREPYNSELELDDFGRPATRLILGVSKSAAAFDILHVRGGEKVLVSDFTLDDNFADDESLLAVIRQTAAEIGFDKVGAYPDVIVPFDKWAAEHSQYNLSTAKEPIQKVYYGSIDHAYANGERDVWRASSRANKECAQAITKLITDNTQPAGRGSRLDAQSVVEQAVKMYGAERVGVVLAAEIQEHNWDGRYSAQNKDWAASVQLPYRTDNFGISSHPVFVNAVVDKYKEYLLQLSKSQKQEQKSEPAAPPRDGSHNISNAEPTAKRAESEVTMEQNTKFEVSSMSKLEEGGSAKAIGTLVVNGEFVVNGVKVVEGGEKGLFVAMPQEKDFRGDYKDIVFPVTKEARAAIDTAVLNAYEQLAASPDRTLKNEISAPEKSVSKVYAQMHAVESDKTQTKAAGQITIDSCLVVTGVKVNEGTNAQGQTKTFVAMPTKPQNERGSYDEICNPITADFRKTMEKSVVAAYNNIGRYEYKGVKYNELENPTSSKAMNPKYADKLMAELDKRGIPYQARCAETTVISVSATNKQAFAAADKELTAHLNGKDKPQQKQEQSRGAQTQKR